MIGLVLAAGRGTRMAPYSHAVCKEMLPVGDTPVIEYTIRYLAEAGIEKVYIVVGERKEQIMEYIRRGSRFGLNVAYVYQDAAEGVGTAKAVQAAEPWIREEFLVAYGDAFFHPGVFIAEMVKYHQARESEATIGLYPMKSPGGFGVVKVGEDSVFLELVEKPTQQEAARFKTRGHYLVNSGPIIFSPAVFDYARRTTPSAKGEYLLTDTIMMMKGDGRRVYGYTIPGNVFWRDIGTPRARLEADRYVIELMSFEEKMSSRLEL